jgi:hypothetical protein
MGLRQRQWAKRARVNLMDLLGGKCAHCGTRSRLTFDCIIPQGDKHHKFDTSRRMSFYRQQHFNFGNVQILCEKHQAKKSLKDRKRLNLLFLVKHPRRRQAENIPF